MAKIARFEDIEGWQKARELTRRVYACTREVPFSKDFALRDQIRRSAISVMANIAEGFERDGVAEFIHFLSIAKGSLAELESHLYVASDQNYVARSELARMQALPGEAKRLIAGFMHYLRRSGLRGLKFQQRAQYQVPGTRNEEQS